MKYIGELSEDKELIYGNKDILIYGTGGYGEKLYRNLKFFNREKDIKGLIENDYWKQGDFYHGIPIISVEDACTLYSDNSIICIGGEVAEIEKLLLLLKMKNVHYIKYNFVCERWGTEYGGFYIPKTFGKKNLLVYSFGIGEDLSFSEQVVISGGTVYAFDPTPKAIKYVENHSLFSNPRFHFYPYGLSDKDGEEYFYLPLRTDFVSASAIQHRSVDKEHPIKVKMKTLRTIMGELGHKEIDILKMDIEGSEFKVVNDMMNPNLEAIHFKLFCVETHERFFETRTYVDHLFETMQKKGFYDFYGTVREPTFVKLAERNLEREKNGNE